MARIRKLSLVCFFTFIIIPQVHAEVSLTKLVEMIQPAIVTVRTYDVDNQPLSQGTGFFISSKGYLVTNYHVLEGAYSAEIITYDHKLYPIKFVVGVNNNVDLIKVSVDIWPEQSVRWLKLTKNLPSLAERVLVVGSPLGLDLTVSDGIVSAIRDIPNMGKVFQLTAPISTGSSGSPVVNMKGEVLGVASFMIRKGQNLNFAIPGKYVLDIETDKKLSLSQLNTHAIDKETSKYTSISPKVLRPEVIKIDGQFFLYDNGTVKDNQTGLMWASKDNGKHINWEDAKRYCENYRGGGYTDWRMPTIDELEGLYDKSEGYRVKQKEFNVYLTKLIELSACCPWASEKRGSWAAHFYFLSGRRHFSYEDGSSYGVRALPVRSGK